MSKNSALSLWIRLAKCYGLMIRAVRNGQRNSELTLPQFDAMAQLLRNPDGMTVNDLSEVLLVTAGNITGLVTRLEARGWVTRKVLADDRRVRVLRLTPKGKRIIENEIVKHEELLQMILRELPNQSKQQLISGLDRMRQALEKSKD